MSIDETISADQIEQEAPAIEEVAEDTELQSDTEQLGEETGEKPEGEVDDSEEIELDGAKYRIPKAVKPLLMMQADYTRKTQEVAEQRRALESEREAHTKSIQAQMEHVADIGRIKVFDESLDQYRKVDWATLRATNPEQANAAFQDMMVLQQQRDALAEKVDKALQERSRTEREALAKRAAETHATLEREIPGWNQETANKVRDFALASGINRDQMTAIATTPSLAKLLHLAWLGDQFQKEKKAALAKAKASATTPAAQVEAKPVPTVGRKPSGHAKPGVHDGLSIDEWMRRENARVARLRSGA